MTVPPQGPGGTAPDRARRPHVLLAAHGSSTHPGSMAGAWALACDWTLRRDELEIAGAYAAFWKAEPSLRDAMGWLPAGPLVVLPLFMSEGFFTSRVLPTALGLHEDAAFNAVHRVDGRAVAWMQPLGSDDRLLDAVDGALVCAARERALEPGRCTVVVVGHGTERDVRSSARVLELVERLRLSRRWHAVHPAFIDQAPRLDAVAAQLQTSDTLLVPFFASEGMHVTDDLPSLVATAPPGCAVHQLPAAGAGPAGVTVALDLLADARRLLS